MPAGNTIITLLLLVFGNKVYAQDSSQIKEEIVTSIETSQIEVEIVTTFVGNPNECSIDPYPTPEDFDICSTYRHLSNSQPSKENYANYYKLACSLWQLSQLPQAEKMFMTIIKSKAPYYKESYYYSSDIPGDTTTNIYGYGSFTFNYKNSAALYLTKINIEKQQFAEALKFVKLADIKYTVSYNCGSGYYAYRKKIDCLYAMCYEGLGKNDSIINMFLPDYSKWNTTLINAIKKVYTPSQIMSNLINAEQSLVFELDTFQSATYTTNNYGKVNEEVIETKYTSGKASMILFGKEIQLRPPYLKDGEVVSKERFLKEFKKSNLYKGLKGGD